MPDRISEERRSWNMSRIQSGGTFPEMAVRRALWRLGYRYRLHARELPGKPDILFRGRRKAIFVHGCFWHQHPCPACADARLPKSKTGYWGPKLARNVQRDAENARLLEELGYEVLVVWDCETRSEEDLGARLARFLGPRRFTRAHAPRPQRRGPSGPQKPSR
jgi:DNA mismatch endonuclease (patch repair protein)